jgi:hypothetical protein
MSGAVIGMIYQNGNRTVNLLRKHESRKPMGPSELSKAQLEVGAPFDFFAMTIRAADQECQIGNAADEAAEFVGEATGGQLLTSLFQGYDIRLGRNASEQKACFLLSPKGGRCCPRLRCFDETDGGDARLASQFRGTIQVIFGEGLLRCPLEPANGEDVQTHGQAGLDGNFLVGRQGRPKLFKIVEASDFGAEKMNDYVAGVDKNPIALLNPFNAQISEACSLELLDKVIGYGRYVTG